MPVLKKKTAANGNGVALTLSALILTLPVTATSAVLSSHYAVDAYARASNLVATETPTIQGDTMVETGVVSSNTGSYSAEVRAQSGPDGLRAYADASSPGSNFSSAVGQAMWRDILFLSGPSLPDDVLFNFTVDATLYAAQGLGSSDVSRAGVSVIPTQSTFNYPLKDFFVSGPGLRALAESVGGNPVETSTSATPGLAWGSTNFSSNGDGSWDFTGTFSYQSDVRSAALLGTPDAGASIAVSLSTLASARSSESWSDAFSTLTLTSVTNIDGTPLSPDITTYYDSPLGAPVAAVPVPAAAWLMASGLLMLASRARRHQ